MNLDEYLGLPGEHKASYHHFMWSNLFSHINVTAKQAHIPSGMVSGGDVPVTCARYEQSIRDAGGIDDV